MNVGEKIKKLRELKNYTQQHMAEELDLSLSGYGKIERNETDISVSKPAATSPSVFPFHFNNKNQ
jgi:transcriptional regulator with XRE-family HTH domain